MNIEKFITLHIFNLFILTSLFTRFIGINKFENSLHLNKYFSYKKIFNENLKSNIKGAIILDESINFRYIPIFKKPIGKIKINNEEKIMDIEGNFFEDENISKNELISVEGNFLLWPEYYKKLEELGLIENILQVFIYSYRIDIYLQPGVLIQLSKNIENLKEFIEDYPDFFQPNTLIDLRCCQRIGISKFNNFSKFNHL